MGHSMKQYSKIFYLSLITGIILNLTAFCQAQSQPTAPDAILNYGSLYHLALSPDEKHFATSGPGGLFLWDIESGHMVHNFYHTGYTPNFSFSTDGTQILALDVPTRGMSLWDVKSGTLIRTFEYFNVTDGRFEDIPFDGKNVFTIDDQEQELKQWDAQTGDLIKDYGSFGADGFFDDEPEFLFTAFQTPNGVRVLSAYDGMINIWDGESKTKIGEIPFGFLNAATISPDLNLLLLSDRANPIKVVDLHTGELLQNFENTTGFETSCGILTFFPDGEKFLLGHNNGAMSIWDLKTESIQKTLQEHNGFIRAASFSKNGKTFLSASSDESIKLWDANTENLLHSYTGHSSYVSHAYFSPDGESVFIIGKFPFEGSSMMREVETDTGVYHTKLFQQVDPSYTSMPNYKVIASNDGSKVLAIGDENKSLNLLDAQTGEVLQSYGNQEAEILTIRFSPDNSQIITGSQEGAIKIFDASTGEELRSINLEPLATFALSPDMKKILLSVFSSPLDSQEIKGTSKLYDLQTEILLRTFPGAVGSFSPDGKMIANSDNNLLKVWNAESGALIYQTEAHPPDWYHEFFHTKFSPDGKLLLTGGNDGLAKLWKIDSGELLHTFGPHEEMVKYLDFSPDGAKVLIVFQDETIRLWNINNLPSMAENFEVYN